MLRLVHPSMRPAGASRAGRLARPRRRAAGFLVLLVLAACTDDPTAIRPPADRSEAGAVADSAGLGPVVEPQLFSRFSIDVSTAGAFRPGAPVQIMVRTTAHIASPEVQLRVVVPELDAPARRPRTADRAAPPARKPSRDAWTASLAAGGTDRHVTPVVFPGPGTYHVVVEASHPIEPGPLVVDGRRVQHVASEMIEVEISERGVRARPARGPVEVGSARLPRDYCLQPTSTTGTEWEEPCQPEPWEPPPPPPPSNVVWVWTAIWYSGPDMSTYEPVRRARVNYSGSGVPTGQSTTDEGGYVLLPCNPSTGLTGITVTLEGPDVRMTATHTSVSTTINMQPQCYGGGWAAWYNWSEGRTWDNLLKAVDGSRSYFGFARGQVRARVGGTASCPGSCYIRGADEILIYPNDVWGVEGDFTAAHEYGHALHARTPAGMRAGCGGPHSWSDAQQDRCLALTEGFATYVALTARGRSALWSHYVRHAEDYWRTICPGVGNCETRVASFLLDLSEPAVDPYGHGIHLPARRVFDMIGQCSQTFIFYDWEWDYVTSRWTQSQRSALSEVWECLDKRFPLHRGTMMDSRGRWVDIILESIAHPWAPLAEPVRSAVLGRLGR